MTQPTRPVDALKRAVDNVAAARQAIQAESRRIAEERAAASPPPSEPTAGQR